jgi:hypothetical protein
MIPTKNLMMCLLILFALLAHVSLVAGNGEFSFEILTDKKTHNIKRSVEIRLDRRITSEQLESIAHKIKALNGNHYKRTFILYYLPYQKPGAGAWATTHFTPNLEVEILGATVEDAKKFRAYSIKNGWQTPEASKNSPQIWGAKQPINIQYGGEIIGEWIWDLSDLSRKITIFKKNGTFFMNRYYRDGSQETVQLKAAKVARGLRLEETQPNAFGEHSIINKKGELEFFDADGIILALPPEQK